MVVSGEVEVLYEPGQDDAWRDLYRDIVLRYFDAFGPASVADVTTWSRFTGCREVVERLRPKLRVYLDPNGRELYDLADRELVDADMPAPPRVLPEYDNVLLAFADRTRVLPETYRRKVIGSNGDVAQTFLVDGSVAGMWRVEGGRVLVEPFAPLTGSARRDVEEEAERLEAFLTECA